MLMFLREVPAMASSPDSRLFLSEEHPPAGIPTSLAIFARKPRLLLLRSFVEKRRTPRPVKTMLPKNACPASLHVA